MKNYSQSIVYLDSLDYVAERLSGVDAIVCDQNVFKLYGKKLNIEGKNLCILESSEQNKSVDTFLDIMRAFLAFGLRRGSVIAALGGGVVGDVAGFAASCYMRGIDYIQIPTTLLSMVDSSVGGKTGVNFEGLKNYIGAFYCPKGVVICPKFLITIEKQQFLSGVGEIVKCAMLDGDIYKGLIELKDDLRLGDILAAEEMIRLCVSFKERVVQSDFLDKGERKKLNLGHTAGHALESMWGFKYTHGECVLSGMAYEFERKISKPISVDILEAIKLIEFFQGERITIQDENEFNRLMQTDKKL